MAQLHVTFGQSAGGSLKRALPQARVICEPDDLGCGPIRPHDGASRARYWADDLGYDDDELASMIDEFWAETTSTPDTVVAWISRRCVREYAGLLELVSRRDGPMLVVDVGELKVSGTGPFVSMGEVSDLAIVDNDLFARGRPLTDSELQQERARWKHLTDENAELRVLGATGLVSAPVTFFDELLVSLVMDEWQRCARVIGDAVVRAVTGVAQTSDPFLWWRLRSLVDDGVLEGKGDMRVMRDSWVRRASSRSNTR